MLNWPCAPLATGSNFTPGELHMRSLIRRQRRRFLGVHDPKENWPFSAARALGHNCHSIELDPLILGVGHVRKVAASMAMRRRGTIRSRCHSFPGERSIVLRLLDAVVAWSTKTLAGRGGGPRPEEEPGAPGSKAGRAGPGYGPVVPAGAVGFPSSSSPYLGSRDQVTRARIGQIKRPIKYTKILGWR
jgi:hypothetical protein